MGNEDACPIAAGCHGDSWFKARDTNCRGKLPSQKRQLRLGADVCHTSYPYIPYPVMLVTSVADNNRPHFFKQYIIELTFAFRFGTICRTVFASLFSNASPICDRHDGGYYMM